MNPFLILLSPFKLFVFNPLAVFAMAMAFAIPSFLRFYTRRSRRTLAVVAFIWFIYGIWELYMTSWRSPTGDMAIRVDMILIAPVVLIASVVGIVAIFRGYQRAP